MANWPGTLPAPLKTVSLQIGSKMETSVMISGRRIVRNWGEPPPDRGKFQLRITKSQLRTFHFFWERTGLSGIYFFAAWLPNMGYDNHMARFIGYPKCKGVTGNIIDFTFSLLIQDTNDVILFTEWPTRDL